MINRFLAMSAFIILSSPGYSNEANAQTVTPTQQYKADKLPENLSKKSGYIWIKMGKGSAYRRDIEANIGLGILVGKVKTKDTGEIVPLKKINWPSIQIAPFDEELNAFRGKGEAKKNKPPRNQTRSFYIRPKGHILEDGDFRHYLIKVTPGRYVLGGTERTCFCWGSLQFDVKPGVITDLGNIYIAPEDGTSYWEDLRELRVSNDLLTRPITITDAMRVDMPVTGQNMPDVLESFTAVPANYAPAKNFGNYYGRLANVMIGFDQIEAEYAEAQNSTEQTSEEEPSTTE